MAWLEMLIWPEDDARRALLRSAVDVARFDPPHLLRGDLRTDLPALVDEASAYGTVVVFHSAVLAYISDFTLLDTAYLTGGIDAPLQGAQLRFGDHDVDAWATATKRRKTPC